MALYRWYTLKLCYKTNNIRTNNIYDENKQLIISDIYKKIHFQDIFKYKSYLKNIEKLIYFIFKDKLTFKLDKIRAKKQIESVNCKKKKQNIAIMQIYIHNFELLGRFKSLLNPKISTLKES